MKTLIILFLVAALAGCCKSYQAIDDGPYQYNDVLSAEGNAYHKKKHDDAQKERERSNKLDIEYY